MIRPLALLFLLCVPAFAATIERPLPDPALERQAQHLFAELRCVVCEGQALAESDAALARQMRSEIRDMVAGGKSENDVLDYFRARYGDRILLNPPLGRATALLWLGPVLLLALGASILWRYRKKESA
jgi:cytochrome c-type biogenesis protein CcmH